MVAFLEQLAQAAGGLDAEKAQGLAGGLMSLVTDALGGADKGPAQALKSAVDKHAGSGSMDAWASKFQALLGGGGSGGGSALGDLAAAAYGALGGGPGGGLGGVIALLGKLGVSDPSKAGGVASSLSTFLSGALSQNQGLLDQVFSSVPFLSLQARLQRRRRQGRQGRGARLPGQRKALRQEIMFYKSR